MVKPLDELIRGRRDGIHDVVFGRTAALSRIRARDRHENGREQTLRPAKPQEMKDVAERTDIPPPCFLQPNQRPADLTYDGLQLFSADLVEVRPDGIALTAPDDLGVKPLGTGHPVRAYKNLLVCPHLDPKSISVTDFDLFNGDLDSATYNIADLSGRPLRSRRGGFRAGVGLDWTSGDGLEEHIHVDLLGIGHDSSHDNRLAQTERRQRGGKALADPTDHRRYGACGPFTLSARSPLQQL